VPAIDADVEELLSALLTTPMAALARDAINSIVDEPPEEDFFSDLHDLRRLRFDRFSREGQLELAHTVITGRIKREIQMLERIRVLAPLLGLKSLSILPEPGETAASRDSVNLLDPAREDALGAFLGAWAEVRAELRQRWGDPYAV
jgi:hypothetical protein